MSSYREPPDILSLLQEAVEWVERHCEPPYPDWADEMKEFLDWLERPR